MLTPTAKVLLAAAGTGIVGTGLYFAAKYIRGRKPKEIPLPQDDTFWIDIYQPVNGGWRNGKFLTRDGDLAISLNGIEAGSIDGLEDSVPLWQIDAGVVSCYIVLCKILKEQLKAKEAKNKKLLARLVSVEKHQRKVLAKKIEEAKNKLANLTS